jgi:adenylosuccinate synthase
LESLRLCTAYRRDGKLFTDLPFGPADLSPYEPVYEELTGWREDVSAVRTWADLPPAAKTYLERLTGLAGVPVRLVSVGPEREQIVNHP